MIPIIPIHIQYHQFNFPPNFTIYHDKKNTKTIIVTKRTSPNTINAKIFKQAYIPKTHIADFAPHNRQRSAVSSVWSRLEIRQRDQRWSVRVPFGRIRAPQESRGPIGTGTGSDRVLPLRETSPPHAKPDSRCAFSPIPMIYSKFEALFSYTVRIKLAG